MSIDKHFEKRGVELTEDNSLPAVDLVDLTKQWHALDQKKHLQGDAALAAVKRNGDALRYVS
ncbi:MAG TPA: hypothetical protein VM223_00940, partial [Planctomycetota bacterium]|nr:hypothetical protein [Planctomycetota bacterium]